jgi:hypothetical protein
MSVLCLVLGTVVTSRAGEPSVIRVIRKIEFHLLSPHMIA